MAKSFKGLGKGNAPKLTDFEKEVYGVDETKELNIVHDHHVLHEIEETIEVNDDHELTPFSTRITKGLYRRVSQFEYWERTRITEIVEQALTQYLEGKETASKPLPEKEIKRREEISKKKKRKD